MNNGFNQNKVHLIRGLYERLFHVKRAIRMFVSLKSQMNLEHEYALMIMQDTALWVKIKFNKKKVINILFVNIFKLEDFTNDPNVFNSHLEYLNQTSNCTNGDLNSVFDVM